MEKFNCRVCSHEEGNVMIQAKEMMSGSLDVFDYIVCSACESVQIREYVSDMSKYYDNTVYYSFRKNVKSKFAQYWFTQRNNSGLFGRKNFIGFLLNKLYPAYLEHSLVGKILGNDYNKAVLDVGCGNGDFIRLLVENGYKKCLGIDPFLAKDIDDGNLQLKSKSIFEMEGRNNFDVIRLHHVFEHMERPYQVISKIESLLSPAGRCVITIPIAGSVFELYRADSYILQAPHHFYLFSISGFEKLISRSNLVIESIVRNANGIANWIKISELWKRGLTMSSIDRPINEYFTKEEIKRFEYLEAQLKSQGLGDNVSFILRAK